VLLALKEAGLTSLPGGGAEVFQHGGARHHRGAQADRRGVAPGPSGSRTSSASRPTAPCSTATSRHPRTASLTFRCCGSCRTRPAAFSPTSRWRTTRPQRAGRRDGPGGHATTGYEDLKNIAVARLFLDNIPT
jgi:aminodeoxyfutalosine synthase